MSHPCWSPEAELQRQHYWRCCLIRSPSGDAVCVRLCRFTQWMNNSQGSLTGIPQRSIHAQRLCPSCHGTMATLVVSKATWQHYRTNRSIQIVYQAPRRSGILCQHSTCHGSPLSLSVLAMRHRVLLTAPRWSPPETAEKQRGSKPRVSGQQLRQSLRGISCLRATPDSRPTRFLDPRPLTPTLLTLLSPK